ncbi:MAG: hypothetical protein M1812_007591 [Candelaria pacifica]|nr:MAG: hypothetical protein M1812_007591 [Candelaria pacifica]
MSSTRSVQLGFAAGAYGAIVFYWFTKVMTEVPEPYLDEVFHVRQSQAYLARQWKVWDPKITTPPGLYLLSVSVDYIFSRSPLISDLYLWGNSTTRLRSINLLAAAFFLPYSIKILCALSRHKNTTSHGEASTQRPACSEPAHRMTVLATDAHRAINICLFPPLFFFFALYYTDVWSLVLVLQTLRTSSPWFWGMAALLFRQTNIFWVAIFPAGLEVVRTLKRRDPRNKGDDMSYAAIAERSWRDVEVYDPFVSEARLEDYAKVCVSVSIAAIASIRQVFRRLVPYLATLGVFAVFIVWNGGVVLGDKTNHVATVHLPQMLYFWPYIFFFSFPVICPYILNALLPQNHLPYSYRYGSLGHRLPHLSIAIPILALMLATIHFNTIVHPFTLADNRHYVFYVFRILLRHPAIKYLAAPVYFICAWAAITALGGIPMKPQLATSNSQKSESRTSEGIKEQAADANRVSFVIVWLSTTTLSLITAPLVEPRYFIIPWVLWRINLPTQRRDVSEHLIWLETAWFLLVNFVTGYIFLYWGFEWPQEPGKVQRFMW